MRRIAMLAAVAALWGCGGEEEGPEPYDGEVVCPVVRGRDGKRICVPAPPTAETCIKLPKATCEGHPLEEVCRESGSTCRVVEVVHSDSTETETFWTADVRCYTDAEYRGCY